MGAFSFRMSPLRRLQMSPLALVWVSSRCRKCCRWSINWTTGNKNALKCCWRSSRWTTSNSMGMTSGVEGRKDGIKPGQKNANLTSRYYLCRRYDADTYRKSDKVRGGSFHGGQWPAGRGPGSAADFAARAAGQRGAGRPQFHGLRPGIDDRVHPPFRDHPSFRHDARPAKRPPGARSCP